MHDALFTANEKVVAFFTCTLSWSFLFGVHFFSFFLLTIYFFHPLIFLLGYALFTFFYFLIIWKPLQKGKEEHITELNQLITKYDTYSYQSITLAPLGDGFPWWKFKNSRSDGLMNTFYCALKSSFAECRNCTKGCCKIYTLFLS